MPRSFLLLQGTASFFFRQLSCALLGAGHAVKRVNFCGGDLLYGGAAPTLNYRGSVTNLAGWYRDVVQREGITDVLMFGDCREVHRQMHAVAEAAGLRVYVFEEGYVRPHWITLERHGVNGRSLMPRDPDWYMAKRDLTPSAQPALATGYSLAERACHDILYRAANAVFAPRFPRYRSHRPENGIVEYAGLAVREMRKRKYHREAEAVTLALLETGEPYYLLPLQLNSDAQIIVHSPFEGVRDAIDRVIHSFALHAPADTSLLVKNHPLDTGIIEYRHYALRIAEAAGIKGRVKFIDAGHLPTLLEHAKGVVVVNSTVGLSALHHGLPLIALGEAIYNIRGLTWQGGLDDFWVNGSRPDADLYRAFLDYVIHHTQINGDFYTRTGVAMAVAGAVERLERDDG